MIHNHWHSIVMLSQGMALNHDVLCWIIGYYAEPVVLNYCVLCWAVIGCESWCDSTTWFTTLAQHSTPWFSTTGTALPTVTHNKWHSIAHCEFTTTGTVSSAVPVVVNHGVICCACGCESCCVILSQWLWIMVSSSVSVVVNHAVQCYDTPWFTTTGSA
jgi:hypothetical protein